MASSIQTQTIFETEGESKADYVYDHVFRIQFSRVADSQRMHVVAKYTDEKVLTIEFDIDVSDARCSFGQFLGEMMGDLKVVGARGEWSEESKNNLMSYEFNRNGKMKNMVTFQLPDRNIVLELKKKCEFKYTHTN
jgi:hypothetical protein